MKGVVFFFVFLAVAAAAYAEEMHHWNASRGYGPFPHATHSGILISNESSKPLSDTCMFEACEKLALSFRAWNGHNNPGKRYGYMTPQGRRASLAHPSWGFFLINNRGQRLSITVSTREKPGITGSVPGLCVSWEYAGEKGEEHFATKNVSPYESANAWQLDVDGGNMELKFGKRSLSETVRLNLPECGWRAFGFTAFPGAELNVADINLTLFREDAIPAYGPEELGLLLAEAERRGGIEGEWLMCALSLEDTMVRSGGEYRLAVIAKGSGYELIYLAGAEKSLGSWQPGMLKGNMEPSPVPGTFGVEWRDAEGVPMCNGLKARIDPDGLLEIIFPRQSSSLTFRKITLPSAK